MATKANLLFPATGADANRIAGLNLPTGAVYFVKVGLDNAGAQHEYWEVFYAGTPASDADFDTLPLNTYFTDTTNHKLYIHTAAATWTVVGAQS